MAGRGRGRGEMRSSQGETMPGPQIERASGAGAGARADRAPRRDYRNDNIRTCPLQFNKRGTKGEPIELVSNYFELIKRPDMQLLQYRVDFSPEIDHMGLRKSMIRGHEHNFNKYIFDGTLLYCTNHLSQPFELFSTRESDGKIITITFKLVGEITKDDNTYITVMNIIVRRCLAMLKLVMIKRDYFDPLQKKQIPNHNLTIWPGYLTSIRPHDRGLLLGVEIIHKVMRNDTAIDVIDFLRKNNGGSDLVNRIKAELEGKIVMTHYNSKTYRIDDIDFVSNPQSKFHLRKENCSISYIDYFKLRYQINIKNDTQPLLVSRPTRRDLNRGDDEPIFLIPELCGMTGLTDSDRKNFTLMKDVANVTRVDPTQRVESLMRFRKRLEDDEGICNELRGWGLEFDLNLVKVEGRSLGRDTFIVQNQSYNAPNGDWSAQMRGKSLKVPVTLKSWIAFYPKGTEQDTMNFVKEIINAGRQHSFTIPDPKYEPLERENTSDYVTSVKNKFTSDVYTMVFIVMKTNRGDTYSAIKKTTCIDLGVPSQVITWKNIQNSNRLKSIATKVMLQIASKMGAEPWQVSLPQQPGKRIMVVGYDTYHDARQKKAVGAFLASTNDSFTRYVSSVMLHENNEDISPSFSLHLNQCVKSYFYQNRTFPTDIIIYRDGVGAGDIARVKDMEFGEIQKACECIAKATGGLFTLPGIALIVVSKRISTRIFTKNKIGSYVNPPCGTVVDNSVTQPERYDFFLVSQKANQGTVSPTSFNIIEDTTNMPPDIHHQIAYALTHLYYNWAGTLRVPAPVQYAHKLAYLIGECNLPKPHGGLALLPYYL